MQITAHEAFAVAAYRASARQMPVCRVPGGPTIATIQRAVCEAFGVSMRDLLSRRRYRGIARPRQVAYWLCRTTTSQSLPTIARAFAGRDHTTIMHGVALIDSLMQTDRAMFERVTKLRDSLATDAELTPANEGG